MLKVSTLLSLKIWCCTKLHSITNGMPRPSARPPLSAGGELIVPTCEELYRTLNASCSEILQTSFAEDKAGLQSAAHNFVGDMEKWIAVLADRPERLLLDAALREYQSGLLSVVLGQYRQAYSALRLFLEQALAAVYFSAHELELRLWMRGKQDIIWNAIALHEDTGIFSTRYVDSFNPELIDTAIDHREMARKVYRECSEFTHGNFHTHGLLPPSLRFESDVFQAWHDKAETCRLIVVYALCIRYLCVLDDKRSKTMLEAGIMEHLGHIPAIRGFYDRLEE
jgi:hypothetical protein